MNKYTNTVTNTRGDSLANYRVQVVDSNGNSVSIFSDASGTQFTDALNNPINFATTDETGKVEFYWDAAPGHVLQVLDASGSLEDTIVNFASPYLTTNIYGLESEAQTIAATNVNATANLDVRIQEIDCSGGTRRYTIPDALLIEGQRLTVQKTDGGSEALIVTAEGAAVKVNGITGPLINTTLPYARAEIICGREPGTSTLCWWVTFTGA